MNEEIEEALNGLADVTPSEEEMNQIRDTIKVVEGALSKLPLSPDRANYIGIGGEGKSLGYHVVKRKLYYRDNFTSPRPLLECKFTVRKKMMVFIPLLIEQLRGQIVEEKQC